MKLALFDIDGTLIHSGGSGVASMTLAFQEVFGCKNGFEDVALAGRTDVMILKEALAKNGLSWETQKVERFKEKYFLLLANEIEKPRPLKRIMPGLPGQLEELQALPEVRIGLLTGNWAKSAEIKLSHFDLWKYFEFGAFADDDSDRNKLLAHARRRAEQLYGESIKNEEVYVIGDTPADIECARKNGAKAIAVTTGNYGLEQLLAEEPDGLLFDFSNNLDLVCIVTEAPIDDWTEDEISC